MHLEVIVIRQDGSVPVKYGLTMEMESRHAAIKPLLARLVFWEVEGGDLDLY